MSEQRHPFGSGYPVTPPVYPTTEAPASAALPSPAANSPWNSPSAPPVGPGPWHPGPGAPDPSIALTLVITLFFSVFGLIPAYLHTEQARRNGRPTSKYWITFGVTLGAQMVMALLFFLAVVAGLALMF